MSVHTASTVETRSYTEHSADREAGSAPEGSADTEPAGSCKKRVPFAAWLLLLLLLLSQATACFVGAAPSLAGKIDLRVFYASGEIVRSGNAVRLYDYDYQQQVQNTEVGWRSAALPFLYPPFAALLFIPLSFLSYRAAFFTQIVVNLLLLLAAARLLPASMPAFRERHWALLPVAFGCLFGVSIALMQGQISFILLLIYTCSYLLLEQRRRFAAGLLLALALMKFQLVLPVVLLFLLWRQWRVVAGFLLGSLVPALISLAMVGPTGLAAYWQSIVGIAAKGATNAAVAKARYGMFPTDMPNLHGLTYGLSHGAPWGPLLNAVLSLLVLGWAARQRASLLIALPAAMLVSYHMQPHDLTLLLLPLSFVWDRLLSRRTNPSSQRGSAINYGSLILAMLLLTLPLAAIVMGSSRNYLVAIAVIIVMVSAAQSDSRHSTSSPQSANYS